LQASGRSTSAHGQPGTRAIHLAGTLVGWALFNAAIALQRWWWVAAVLMVSYALPWISHFLVEHNRPATLEHPLWSWREDQRKWWRCCSPGK